MISIPKRCPVGGIKQSSAPASRLPPRRAYSSLCPRGRRGRGEVGHSTALAGAGLTLPVASRRVPSLSPRRAERAWCGRTCSACYLQEIYGRPGLIRRCAGNRAPSGVKRSTAPASQRRTTPLAACAASPQQNVPLLARAAQSRSTPMAPSIRFNYGNFAVYVSSGKFLRQLESPATSPRGRCQSAALRARRFAPTR